MGFFHFSFCFFPFLLALTILKWIKQVVVFYSYILFKERPLRAKKSRTKVSDLEPRPPNGPPAGWLTTRCNADDYISGTKGEIGSPCDHDKARRKNRVRREEKEKKKAWCSTTRRTRMALEIWPPTPNLFLSFYQKPFPAPQPTVPHAKRVHRIYLNCARCRYNTKCPSVQRD